MPVTPLDFFVSEQPPRAMTGRGGPKMSVAEEDLSLYAVLHELNGRAFRDRVGQFPEALRYYVILADALVGLENARRIGETPPGVVSESEEFVEKLKGMLNPSEDQAFGEVLFECLLDSLRGELRRSCLNCKGFSVCLQPDQLPIGRLFARRVKGEDSQELRDEIARQVDDALGKIPFAFSDDANERCERFAHNCTASDLGRLFGRYSEIAGVLAARHVFDYRRFLSEMVALNMEFMGQNGSLPHGRK